MSLRLAALQLFSKLSSPAVRKSVLLAQPIWLLILLLSTSSTIAKPWSHEHVNNHKSSFLIGFLSGYMIHELGHVAVATSKGYSVDLDGPSLVYPDLEKGTSDHLKVSTAGFQAQWLASELALRYRETRSLSKRGDQFNAGLVVSHLAISAAYLTALKNHELGDTAGVSQASGLSRDELALLAAIPAVLDAWRLFGDDPPKWVPVVSAGSKGIGLVAIWTY